MMRQLIEATTPVHQAYWLLVIAAGVVSACVAYRSAKAVWDFIKWAEEKN